MPSARISGPYGPRAYDARREHDGARGGDGLREPRVERVEPQLLLGGDAARQDLRRERARDAGQQPLRPLARLEVVLDAEAGHLLVARRAEQRAQAGADAGIGAGGAEA